VTIEFIKSNYLVKQTKSDCDSDTTVALANVPCLDIKSVDTAWASRVGEFDILMFATGGWWEHDLQMRQASPGDDISFRKSHNVIRSSLMTVMDYLGRPEFRGKHLYWRCAEVCHKHHIF
jgi:hypothetical protein